jgi:polysaccharide export outer membrane protein
MTTSAFAEALAKQLHDEGIVTRANIVVSISASRDKSVAITGAVRMPQLYPVYGHTTLLDLISQAQGLVEDASNICVVSRGNLGMQSSGAIDRVQTVDLKKLMQSGDPAYNLNIYPGDHVTVPRAGIVYVVGAVHRPGGFPIKSAKDGMSVMQVLAMAEDMTSTAIKSKAVLIRVDATAEHGRKQMPLSMNDILAGKAPDPILQEDDILYIPDSAAKKAMHRTMDAVIQVATGIAIYGRY